MKPSDIRYHAIDDLMTFTSRERRRFIIDGYERFTEWLQENATDLMEYDPETTVGKVLNRMAGVWIETTEAGRMYLDAYTNFSNNDAA
jgi:hypothetical protein